jgi:uncharacterized protein YjiS (DUF1127 family)
MCHGTILKGHLTMGTISSYSPSVKAPEFSADIWSKFTGILKKWQKRRQEFADLTAMSDYQLQDIGLTRNDVYREFYKPTSERS